MINGRVAPSSAVTCVISIERVLAVLSVAPVSHVVIGRRHFAAGVGSSVAVLSVPIGGDRAHAVLAIFGPVAEVFLFGEGDDVLLSGDVLADLAVDDLPVGPVGDHFAISDEVVQAFSP